MTRMRYLARLPFAAIWRPPHNPILCTTDRVATVPEFRGNSGIGRIAQHLPQLAILYLVTHLRSKLEVVSAIIDRPRPVGFHVDPIIGVGDEVLKAPGTRLQAHIGHADQRNAVPTGGAHAAIRGQSQFGRRLTGHQISDKLTLFDDRRRLGRHAFIIPAKRSQAVRPDAVGGNVDDL